MPNKPVLPTATRLPDDDSLDLVRRQTGQPLDRQRRDCGSEL